MKSILPIIILLLFIGSSQAQKTTSLIAQDVIYYSDIVANAYLPTSKSKAHHQLLTSVENFLASANSFNYDFTDMVWVSIKSPDDNTFRLYTWELQTGENNYDYFGYIQYPDGSFEKLLDQSNQMDDIEYMGLDKDNWYGALYYNILETVNDQGEKVYILFGINKEDEYTNHKVAEVITLDEGNLSFGHELFYNQRNSKDVKQRLHLTYSSDANVTLNYNPGLGMIVFDNLISRMGMLPGQGPTQLPDGSYKGYDMIDGKWVYVDKIYDQISSTVPNATPTDSKTKKTNLFGRKN